MGCCIQAIVKYTRALARSVYAVVFSTAGLLMNFYSCLALDVVDVSVCVCSIYTSSWVVSAIFRL